MGTWGTAIYSDDLAADLRADLRDLVGDGLSIDEAVQRLSTEYSSSLEDRDEAPVFWLAVANTAWNLGQPHEHASREALRVIEAGEDLRRWNDAKDRRKRARVLEKIAENLRSPAPPEKRVAKRFVANNPWDVGELIAYQLASGAWTLFRVIGHHVDKGGRNAICELLDWTGAEPPDAKQLRRLRRSRPREGKNGSQFLVGEARRNQDQKRLVRTGARGTPSQRPHRYSGFVFPYVDRRLHEKFGLE